MMRPPKNGILRFACFPNRGILHVSAIGPITIGEKPMANGKSLTVPNGTPMADVLILAADKLEASKQAGKAYYSKLVVIREEESNKVYLAKAFSDRIGLYTESMHLPLRVEVKRGKPKQSD